MGKRFLFLLSISAAFFSCEKNAAVLPPYTGNNIDSVASFWITPENDTDFISARKYEYNSDFSRIVGKSYKIEEGSNKIVLDTFFIYSIVNNKIIIQDVFPDGMILTQEYTFDYNKFLRTAVRKNNFTEEGDSTVYVYNSQKQLYQSVSVITNTSGEGIRRDKTTNTYTWENDNIKSVRSELSTNGSPASIKYLNYTYSNLENPLDYHYTSSYTGFMRTGIGTKNLPTNDPLLYGATLSHTLYSQNKGLSESRQIEESAYLNKIYYTD